MHPEPNPTRTLISSWAAVAPFGVKSFSDAAGREFKGELIFYWLVCRNALFTVIVCFFFVFLVCMGNQKNIILYFLSYCLYFIFFSFKNIFLMLKTVEQYKIVFF